MCGGGEINSVLVWFEVGLSHRFEARLRGGLCWIMRTSRARATPAVCVVCEYVVFWVDAGGKVGFGFELLVTWVVEDTGH